MEEVDETEGRRLFGSEPDVYNQVRPDYPDTLYSSLVQYGAIFSGAATLEIGPGNGLATRRLITLGANPVTVIEPDGRFRELLEPLSRSCDLRLFQSAFEDTDLPEASFDLAVAATAFHWLDPDMRVDRFSHTLKIGGYAALFSNVFQDLDKRDEFHEATHSTLLHLAASPSGAPDSLPFALDRKAREAEFVKGRKFEAAAYLDAHWTLTLTTREIGLLYGTFSSIARLPPAERADVLRRLMEIADKEFNGVVGRNMTSTLFLFERV